MSLKKFMKEKGYSIEMLKDDKIRGLFIVKYSDKKGNNLSHFNFCQEYFSWGYFK